MKLIIILICLGVERYYDISQLLYRSAWFDAYLMLIQPYIPSKQKHLRLTFILLPILIVISVVYFMFALVAWPLTSLMNLIIVYYCLGPDDLYQQLTDYFSSKSQSDPSLAKHNTKVSSDVSDVQNADNFRTVTTSIFYQTIQRYISVIFWFIALGPMGFLGAIFYRCVNCLHQKIQEDESLEDLRNKVSSLQDLLDWLPIRLTTLIFILVGRFPINLSVWTKNVMSRASNNRAFLTECGLQAIGKEGEEAIPATIEENYAAFILVNRTMFFIVLIVAFFTLGMWVA